MSWSHSPNTYDSQYRGELCPSQGQETIVGIRIPDDSTGLTTEEPFDDGYPHPMFVFYYTLVQY